MPELPDGAGGAPPQGGASPRRFLLPAFRILLTVAVVAAVAWYAFREREAWQGGWDFAWGWLAAAVLLAPLVVLGRAWKWRLVLRPLAPSVTYAQAFASYLGSLPLGLVTPARMGEYSRGMFLPQPAARGMAGAGRVLLDNWTDFLSTLAWALCGAAVLWDWTGLAAGAALLLVFAPIGPWLRLVRGAAARLSSRGGIKEILLRGIPAHSQIGAGSLSRATAAGVLVYAVEWAQLDFLLRFLGVEPPGFMTLGGLLALVALATSVQVTLAGLGVREGVAVYLLAQVGLDHRASVLATFALFFLNLVLPSLAGLAVKPVAAAEAEMPRSFPRES